MKTWILSVVIFASPAWAHIEPGTWMGKTAQQQDCGFLVGQTYYEGNVKHPLNERIQIRLGNDAFVVQHPAVIDPKQSIASFNHDLFQGVLATQTGARALIIQMQHDAAKEGPVSFQWIDHQWKSNQKTSIICRDLKHTSNR